MIRLVQIFVAVMLLASPLLAQADSDTTDRKAELQQWFNSLTPKEQTKLRKRLKVIKRLPKEQQRKMLKSVREGKPALDKQQVKSLKRLGKLSYLKRVRLHILMRELDRAKKSNPQGYKAAMAKSGKERHASLLQLVKGQRTRMFIHTMSKSDRVELEKLPPSQRSKKMRELFESASKSRLEALSQGHPRMQSLRTAAKNGDKRAKKELRELIADLRTLDWMISRLPKEKQRKVLTDIKNLDTDEAAKRVRIAMNEQFKRMRKDRPHKDKRRPRDDRNRANKPNRGNAPGRRR